MKRRLFVMLIAAILVTSFLSYGSAQKSGITVELKNAQGESARQTCDSYSSDVQV